MPWLIQQDDMPWVIQQDDMPWLIYTTGRHALANTTGRHALANTLYEPQMTVGQEVIHERGGTEADLSLLCTPGKSQVASGGE